MHCAVARVHDAADGVARYTTDSGARAHVPGPPEPRFVQVRAFAHPEGS